MVCCGIDDNGLQRDYSCANLTYAKAVDLAQRNETASQQVKVGHPQKPFNRVEDSSSRTFLLWQKSCLIIYISCGKKGHLYSVYKAKGSKCQAPKKYKDIRKP